MKIIVNYGQLRDVNPTEGECEIFAFIKNLVSDAELVRRSDNYVTAAIGEWDVVRFKYTDRAKWLLFPLYGTKKYYFNSLEELSNFEGDIIHSYEEIKKWL